MDFDRFDWWSGPNRSHRLALTTYAGKGSRFHLFFRPNLKHFAFSKFKETIQSVQRSLISIQIHFTLWILERLREKFVFPDLFEEEDEPYLIDLGEEICFQQVWFYW